MALVNKKQTNFHLHRVGDPALKPHPLPLLAALLFKRTLQHVFCSTHLKIMQRVLMPKGTFSVLAF